ncbi:kinase domain protein [Dictyocaulus viviparus]|uniref:Kinase domain protein n=1 Tax=Dictyocaulus viviparus TaxID=29172 RepID=A0A0D8XQ33_DICVI|nr:kinase domain protein [Dictyocaulus viviparus]
MQATYTIQKGPECETNENSGQSGIADSTVSMQDSGKVPETWVIDDFDVGRLLGRGRFGSVYFARSKQEGVVIAIKILMKEEIERHNLRHHVKREIEIQYHLRHPNILQLKGYFHDKERVYMILEFASGGTLYNRLIEKGKLNEYEAAKYVRQLADALNYCQDKKVVHRDIKPQNILLDRKGNVKVDNWAVGVLLHQMLVGRTPYECLSRNQTIISIKECKSLSLSHLSRGASDLIKRLVVKKPSLRLPFSQVLAHPWVVRMSTSPKSMTRCLST